MKNIANKVLFDDLPDNALVRKRELKRSGILPFSDSTHWRKCKDNTFPAPIKVSASITAWRVKEIREWLANPKDYIAVDKREIKKIKRDCESGGRKQ